jgi:putative oxidoreductase
MNADYSAVGLLIGRILMSLIFLLSAGMKALHWTPTAAQMESKGMPIVPLFLVGAIACELAGGLSLLFGFKTRYGALLLALFLIPVTLVMHNFWAAEGQAAENQMQHFLKNVTIIGGLIVLSATGAGRFSLDARLSRSPLSRFVGQFK